MWQCNAEGDRCASHVRHSIMSVCIRDLLKLLFVLSAVKFDTAAFFEGWWEKMRSLCGTMSHS